MIDYTGDLLFDFLNNQDSPFTPKDFQNFVKRKSGQKITLQEVNDILNNSDVVFPLVKNEYITRACAFEGRWFSFKPSKEEVKKGWFIIGHRAMPFINPEISPDCFTVYSNAKKITSEGCSFSTNLVLDTYAMFGEGYSLPIIFNDDNSSISLQDVQNCMPNEITVTAWSLTELSGEDTFEYGDRILGRVIDWNECVIEFQVLKTPKALALSQDAIQREEWYTCLENAFLESFDKHGPRNSIDSQLAVIMLENQEKLCIKNCGSIEEFMSHTKKVCFQNFGVESRIWRKNEEIPYIGKWISEENYDELLINDFTNSFSPVVFDSFVKDNLYNISTKKKSETFEELVKKACPFYANTNFFENKEIIDKLEKRQEFIEKGYNQFIDYPIAEIRKRLLDVYIKISSLAFELAFSGIDAREFSQDELIILSQVFSHCVKMVEQLEVPSMFIDFPIDEMYMSVQGMEFTFDEIENSLKNSLKNLRYKFFSVV